MSIGINEGMVLRGRPNRDVCSEKPVLNQAGLHSEDCWVEVEGEYLMR